MNVIKNIVKVIIGNIATILSGIFVGFLLPKIISVSDYGFYKIFTLYLNYVGVLSIGIIDGIVLKYGDKNYDQLDREKFRGFFAWYTILHLFFTVVLVVSALLMKSVDYQFVFLMLGANLLPSNFTGYFQQLSQITQRFKEFYRVKIIHALLNVLILVVMFFAYKYHWIVISYRVYLFALLGVNLMVSVWYVARYKDVVFGKRVKLKEVFVETVSLAKLGIPLLLANLCTTLILSLDRQFVSIFFTTEQYATYAFAYSMLSFVTVATSAISTVMYPMFKRVDTAWLKEKYHALNGVILMFVTCIILVYYPLCWFIRWFLPHYTESLVIFRIIMPSLVLSTSISVMMHNYYKVFGKSGQFFVKSIVCLAVSFVANIIAYYVFRSREAISIASVISMFIWYVIVEVSIDKTCGFSIKNGLYMLLMMTAFYLCSSFRAWWIGGLCNGATFVVCTLLFYLKDLKNIKMTLGRKAQGEKTAQ